MAKLYIPRHIPTPDEAYNEMMGVKQNGIVEIEIEKLIPYHMADGSLQPFKLYNQEDLD